MINAIYNGDLEVQELEVQGLNLSKILKHVSEVCWYIWEEHIRQKEQKVQSFAMAVSFIYSNKK